MAGLSIATFFVYFRGALDVGNFALIIWLLMVTARLDERVKSLHETVHKPEGKKL